MPPLSSKGTPAKRSRQALVSAKFHSIIHPEWGSFLLRLPHPFAYPPGKFPAHWWSTHTLPANARSISWPGPIPRSWGGLASSLPPPPACVHGMSVHSRQYPSLLAARRLGCARSNHLPPYRLSGTTPQPASRRAGSISSALVSASFIS